MPEETKTTPHGENYTVLTAPDSAEIDTSTFDSHGKLDGDHEYFTLYVSCEDLRVTPLPLDSNPRLPDSYTNADKDVVTAMRRTLANHPGDFVKFNNGITLVCKSVSVNGSTAKLEFGEEEGVLNGGHTYFAIQSMNKAIDDSAMVRLEAIQLNPEIAADSEKKSKEILNIARHRNKNRSLEAHTQANYEGKYESFKHHLDDWQDCVDWAEGHGHRDNALKAKDFVRLLAALDPMWFNHRMNPGDVHNRACVGDVHKDWIPRALDENDQRNLVHMSPLSRAVIVIQDRIRHDLQHGSYTRTGGFPGFRRTEFWKWAGKSKEKSLITDEIIARNKPIFSAFVVGLLRCCVWFAEDENDEISGIGFVRHPLSLFDECRQELYKDVEHYYAKTFLGIPRKLMGSDLHLERFCKMMEETLGVDSETYDFPEVFFSFSTGSWYRISKDDDDHQNLSNLVWLVFDKENETYELDENPDKDMLCKEYIQYPEDEKPF